MISARPPKSSKPMRTNTPYVAFRPKTYALDSLYIVKILWGKEKRASMPRLSEKQLVTVSCLQINSRQGIKNAKKY